MGRLALLWFVLSLLAAPRLAQAVCCSLPSGGGVVCSDEQTSCDSSAGETQVATEKDGLPKLKTGAGTCLDENGHLDMGLCDNHNVEKKDKPPKKNPEEISKKEKKNPPKKNSKDIPKKEEEKSIAPIKGSPVPRQPTGRTGVRGSGGTGSSGESEKEKKDRKKREEENRRATEERRALSKKLGQTEGRLKGLLNKRKMDMMGAADMPTGKDGRPGARRAARKAGSRAAKLPPTISGNLANPKTRRDMIVASMGGFRGAFDRAGLKVGRGRDGQPAILRADGRLASDADVRRLQGMIEGEPKALMKNPRFFDGISRENFQGAKAAFRDDTSVHDTHFRHMGLTEADRDFQWTQSCNTVSGDCNPHTTKTSYERGEFVPPKDLDAALDALNKESHEGVREAQAKLSKRALGAEKSRGIWSRIKGLFSSFGGGDGSIQAAAMGPAGAAPVAPAGYGQGASKNIPAPNGSAGSRSLQNSAVPDALYGGGIPKKTGHPFLWLIAAVGLGLMGVGAYSSRDKF